MLLPRGVSGAPRRLVLAREDPSGTVPIGKSPRLVLGRATPIGRLVLAKVAAAVLVLAAARTVTTKKRGHRGPSMGAAL